MPWTFSCDDRLVGVLEAVVLLPSSRDDGRAVDGPKVGGCAHAVDVLDRRWHAKVSNLIAKRSGKGLPWCSRNALDSAFVLPDNLLGEGDQLGLEDIQGGNVDVVHVDACAERMARGPDFSDPPEELHNNSSPLLQVRCWTNHKAQAETMCCNLHITETWEMLKGGFYSFVVIAKKNQLAL